MAMIACASNKLRAALGALILFATAPHSAFALEVEAAEAVYRDKAYHVSLSLIIDAPSDRVATIVRDYESYSNLDNRILDAKVISRSDAGVKAGGEPRIVILATKLRACSGLFCRTVKRVERVEEKDMELTATVIPEQSDVLSGQTHTMLESLGDRTRVRYQSSVNPNFWVPSFIGRPLMLRTLREASLDLFKHVETRARGAAESHHER